MKNFRRWFTSAPYLYWTIASIIIGLVGSFFLANSSLGIAGNYSLGNSQASATSGVTINHNQISSYAPTSCPNLPFTNRVQVYLPSASAKISQIGLIKKVKKTVIVENQLTTAGKVAISLANPILIAPSATTSSFEVDGTGWRDYGICNNGSPDQWYVGGDATLNSKDQIVLVNSGQTPATIELNLYGKSSNTLQIVRNINPNSQSTFGLAGLLPGDPSPAVEVLTLTGRVTSYLLDARAHGLASLGGGLVPSSNAPATYQIIPGVKVNSGNKSFLRLLAPGAIDANLSVKVISNNGAYTPLGLDQVSLHHQRVIDLPLTNLTTTNPVAIAVTSDQPILAGVGVSGASSPAWFGSAINLQSEQLTLGNVSPTLSFYSDWNNSNAASANINSNKNTNSGSVTIKITFGEAGGKNAKSGIATLILPVTAQSSNSISWSAPYPLTYLAIDPVIPSAPAKALISKVFGALTFSGAVNRSLVLAPGTTIYSVSAPHPDAKVLSE
jgi:Family of unknown function (DUF5719)